MEWFITTLRKSLNIVNEKRHFCHSLKYFFILCQMRNENILYIFKKKLLYLKRNKILHIRTIFVASRERKKRIYRSKERRFSAEMRLFAFFEVMFHSRAMARVKKLRPALWRYVYVLYQSNNGSLGAVETLLHAGLDLHAIFKCEDLRYGAGKQILMPAYDEPPFQVCYWK